MGKCLSTVPKEQHNINTQKKHYKQHNVSKKQYNNYSQPNKNLTSDEARANAAIAAQNRLQTMSKSPPNVNITKITKQKKKMAQSLEAIDQREKELEQMRQNRIAKGQSVE